MFKDWKKLGLAAAGAIALAGSLMATPATARHRDHDGDDTAAIAIGAGVLGLIVGAAIADDDDDRYYDRRFYNDRHYVTYPGRPGYFYYYEGYPNRYYRDRYYDRYYGRYYRDRWGRGRDRGYYGGGWRERRYHDDRRWHRN